LKVPDTYIPLGLNAIEDPSGKQIKPHLELVRVQKLASEEHLLSGHTGAGTGNQG
jgi:hypothetical protein